MDKLILTDMDGTLIGGDRDELEQFKQWLGAQQDVGFGVVTGRSKESAYRGLEEAGIADVDVVICAVGTEIFYGDQRTPDHDWSTLLEQAWQRERIEEALADLPFARHQNVAAQGRFKLGYQGELAAKHLQQVQERLRQYQLAVTVVFSHNWYLDILPPNADKSHAVMHVAQQLEMELSQVLVAGDSANDQSMLTLPGVNAVLVGNHLAEVMHLNEHPGVYSANCHHAAGILEGARFFEFDR